MERRCVNPRIYEVDYDETEREEVARRCARNILSVMAEEFVNDDGSIVDNYMLADKYQERYPGSNWSEYLLRWVEYVYLDIKTGKTYFKLSKHYLC